MIAIGQEGQEKVMEFYFELEKIEILKKSGNLRFSAINGWRKAHFKAI